MTRQANINNSLLGILDDCDGHALPQSTVLQHLHIRERRVTDDEFAAGLKWLEEQGCIKQLPGKFGSEEPRWLITESGQVRLAQ